MNSAIRARREAEAGFTLIELLVVVIIIGILAAIAIPAFLNQRERAWQAELTSAVRNGALEVEAQATSNNGDYTGAAAAGTTFITNEVGLPPIAVIDATDTATGFVLCATHASITDAHNVTYLGGDEPTVKGASNAGIQGFSEAGDCTSVSPAGTA